MLNLHQSNGGDTREFQSRMVPSQITGSSHLNIRSRLGIRTPAGGGTPYDGLYGEVPPERGTFFRIQVYERVGIFLVVVELKG